MIDLLPPEDKRQLRAARSNTLLVRYNVLLVGAVFFLGIASGVTYFYLGNVKAAAEQTIADNHSKVSGYASVEAEAEAFRSNLATAKQILDKDIPYTSVILKIAQLLPSGAVLDTISLDPQTFGSSTTLVARVKDYDTALALKNSFQASSLFTDVHFQSISASDGAGGYPITVNLSVTFSKGAAQQ